MDTIVKTAIGIASMIIGLCVAAYVGLWLMFVGGIMQVIDGVKSDPVDGSDVAWGIVRIVFASPVSGIAAFFFFVIALSCFRDNRHPYKLRGGFHG